MDTLKTKHINKNKKTRIQRMAQAHNTMAECINTESRRKYIIKMN